MAEAPLPELLAPAGCWESLKAAAVNGADAVYFGVETFNARLRAENFKASDLPEVMDWLHRRGLKGFLTFNVLVFTDELSRAAELLLAADAAGVDALIVQDIGLAALAQQLTPELAIHGSTQMSITSAAGVAMAQELGCQRVVLARELSLKDLQRIQQQLVKRQLEMPLEVFVHGALCVAYSGQCLTSEALGQRSANRGECAQACRLPYELIVDGEELDLGEQRYLLSPQDLAAWDLLPELVDAGVASLKIEGRLKDPTYVAAVTDAYRQGLDRLSGERTPLEQSEQRELRRNLELSFSRGLSTGWLAGIDHRQLVHGRWSKKRGPWLGRLERVDGDWLLFKGRLDCKAGDGLVLEVPHSDPLLPPKEVGGRVMAIEPRPKGGCAVRLGPKRVDLRGLRRGSPCWLTSDPQRESRFQRMAERSLEEQRRPLVLKASGSCGTALRLEVVRAAGLSIEGCFVLSEQPLAPAQGQALNRERLEQQLGRLGGTPWRLEQLELELEPDLFLPLAQLNQLRRQLVDQLAQQATPVPPTIREQRPAADLLEALIPPIAEAERLEPQLSVLVRDLDQLDALKDLPVDRVIVDLEHPAQLREAVKRGKGYWPGGLWLAGQRICRPDESWSLEPLIRAEPDGYLVRNVDQLERLTPLAPCQGDFSLNVANPITARWLLERWGLERLTASYDLALDQLLALVRTCPREALELTLHQHMPLFHMEHCLFCAFLSEGHDHTDCGRPCEQHQVLLRDRSGAEHPLRADLGCRNTLFNARAQTAAEAIPQFLEAGVRHFRLELLQETAADTQRRVALYRQALNGEISGQMVWQSEQLESRLGVTRGTLSERH